jgi:hypothetical protein
MRTIVVMIALAGFALPAIGQTATDSSKATRTQQQHRKHMGKTFVDENGDGINDNATAGTTASKRKRDRFIDLDGDGICDDRARGMGFKRGFGGSTVGSEGSGKGKRMGGKQ